MRSLWVYPEKCTGCNQCLLACSFAKTGKYSPRDGLLHLLSWEKHCLTVPVVCAQCEEAPCESACPEGAIARDLETGALVVDQDLCTRCEICAEACPTGNIYISRYTDTAVKCDLCGGQPACVEVCYPGALTAEERTWAERSEQHHQWQEASEAYARRELPGFRIAIQE